VLHLLMIAMVAAVVGFGTVNARVSDAIAQQRSNGARLQAQWLAKSAAAARLSKSRFSVKTSEGVAEIVIERKGGRQRAVVTLGAERAEAEALPASRR
jgi:hypothetical protein